MKRYGKYIRPCWYAFILGPLLMLTEVAGEVLLPSFMADIINVGAANHDVGYILQKGMIMILTAFIMMAGGVGGAWFASVAAINFGTGLRKDAFKKNQTFSFSEIDRFSTGSLVTRLTNDITQVQNLIMMALRMMLRAPGMLIGAIIMAFLMDRELAAVFLIVLPVMTVVILLLLRIAYPRFEFMQKKLDALNSNIQEVLTNVRVIKSFVREDYESARFEKSNAELKESSLNAFKIAVAQMPLMMLFMNLTTLVVVWLGGNQILGGKMQVGDLTAFTTYIVQVLMSLMMLAMVFLQSSRAFASGRRINEVMDTKVSLTDDHQHNAIVPSLLFPEHPEHKTYIPHTRRHPKHRRQSHHIFKQASRVYKRIEQAGARQFSKNLCPFLILFLRIHFPTDHDLFHRRSPPLFPLHTPEYLPADIHTARSRNDQVAVDFRLYLKNETAEIDKLLAGLNEALLKLSKEHTDTVMPGYTHLQRAQPVTLAYHLLAYYQMISRDRERFADCLKRIDRLPLGSGALAGTTYDTDRDFLARELGFSQVLPNGMDAVADRDFAIEFSLLRTFQ